MKQELMDGTPPGSISRCHPSGWMQTEIFTDWFRHFIKHSASSLANPSLLVNTYVRLLKQMRTDGTFERFYVSCVSEGVDKHGCDPPHESVAHGRRVPKRYDEGAAAHQWNGPEEYFKVEYSPVLDILLNEMASRFDGGMLGKLESLEKCLLRSISGDSDKALINQVKQDLSTTDLENCGERFDAELSLFSSIKLTYGAITGLKIKQVTSMGSVCEILNKVLGSRLMFTQMKIYLTLPLTSCTAERSFSILRRVKTYLRSTMTHKRLNQLLTLHIYKEIVTLHYKN